MRLEQRLATRLPWRLRRRLALEEGTIRPFLAEWAGRLPAGARVLDAGAGEARYRELFAGARYLALDFGRGEAAWDYGRLDLRGDAARLPFAPGSFEAVVSTQVIEHVPDPAALLAECARVLVPGGRLLLTAPLAFGEHQQPHDYFRFTSFGLRRLLAGAGFEVEALTARGGFWSVLQVQLWIAHERLFPTGRRRSVKLLLAPLQALSFVLLGLAPALVLQPLDRFDRRRDTTLGYAVAARRR